MSARVLWAAIGGALGGGVAAAIYLAAGGSLLQVAGWVLILGALALAAAGTWLVHKVFGKWPDPPPPRRQWERGR